MSQLFALSNTFCGFYALFWCHNKQGVAFELKIEAQVLVEVKKYMYFCHIKFDNRFLRKSYLTGLFQIW